MHLGLYTAPLHDRSLADALRVVADTGLDAVELNTGGFLPAAHIPVKEIDKDPAVGKDWLSIFDGTGVSLQGLNCNGNPLHPDQRTGVAHAADLRRSIRVAGALGQSRVVTMSGLPGSEPHTRQPSWVVNAWSSRALDVLEYQWELAVPFWQEIDQLAGDHGVKVAIELHPQNLVFNPPSFLELVERAGTSHIGVELDASHLFWQQMDPVHVVERLGAHVVHAAAKDVRINPEAAWCGVLDNSFRRLSPEEQRTQIGAEEWVNEWPQRSAWDFVALGRGHGADYWARFLTALHAVDPDIACHIEHEDTSLGAVEGVQQAAVVLLEAADLADIPRQG
ncbi:sugar phosphate isomerase/epimerase family protein [Nesterenkonia sphaerica]|uniref:Sugar phosphate isomerase/epimerase n=1 Tax=Nesterenkonia sphaerica TaxID=1804988 RepID=A0A5R9AMI0_9MICC|nr:sugar phosphate isomerase/epimerase [Nesterenkonia sphaerica]TLP80011.1 sugar phosphate isomerase/epimerase [Nesterenkonia sphaerica]